MQVSHAHGAAFTRHLTDAASRAVAVHSLVRSAALPVALPPSPHPPPPLPLSWLKKQFKALVRKYHPDKYKGNKDRANRKFKEVTDAKVILGKEGEC